MATFKGVALESLKKLAKEKPDLEKEFLAKLSPSAKAAYIKAFNVSKIPVEQGAEIKDTFAKLFFGSEPNPLRYLGAVSAQHALQGIYRIFVRISKPSFVLGRVSNIWASYYDKGRCVLGESSSNHAEILLYDFPDIPAQLLEFIAGYILGAIEVSGGKNGQVVKIEDNPEIWKWVISWE